MLLTFTNKETNQSTEAEKEFNTHMDYPNQWVFKTEGSTTWYPMDDEYSFTILEDGKPTKYFED